MLVPFFLAQLGASSLKKFLNYDFDANHPFSLSEAIGSLIGSIANNVLGSKISDKIVLDRHSKSLKFNDDIQRSIRKCFLLSATNVVQFIQRSKHGDKNEKVIFNYIIDYLAKELKKCNQNTYNPEEDDQTNKVYGFLSNKIVSSDDLVTLDYLNEQLNEGLFKEIERELFIKGLGDIPVVFIEAIRNGWQEKNKSFTFFNLMCDYFNEFIKIDPRLKAAIQLDLFHQVLSNVKDVEEALKQFESLLATIGERSVEILGRLEDIFQLLNTQPKLVVYNDFNDSRRRVLFRNRYLNVFLGREREMEKLFSFFQNSDTFSWWLVIGAGGIGKSRLALEFCYALSYEYVINKGFFLSPTSMASFNWLEWRPSASTLIILDYASGYYKEIIEIFIILSNREQEFKYPVRFLLLERDIKGIWWDEIQKSLGYRVKKQPFDKPLEVSKLEDDDLWSIIQKTLSSTKSIETNKDVTLVTLKKIDQLQRPLFAWFVGIAISEGKNIRDWNVNNLLQYQLEREEARFYESIPGGKNDSNQKIVEKHLNLAAISTMVKGMSKPTAERLVAFNLNWLPDRDILSTNIYNTLIGYEEENERPFLPLEPDILGEFFVLQQLQPNSINPFKSKEKASASVEISWEVHPLEMKMFILRVLSDFSENNLLNLFLEKPQPKNSLLYKYFWSELVVDVINYFSALNNQINVEKICEESIALAYDETYKEISIETSRSIFNVINFFNEKQVDKTLHYYNLLLKLANDKPDDEIWLRVAKATYNLIEFLGKQEETRNFYFSKLEQLAKEHPTDEIVVILSDAIINMMNLTLENSEEIMLSYYRKFEGMILEYPLDKIQINFSEATANLIVYYEKRNFEKALTYYENLKSFFELHPLDEIFKWLSKSAGNIVLHFGSIDVQATQNYYLELKSLAHKYPSPTSLDGVAMLAFVLSHHIFILNQNEATFYFSELKELLSQHSSNYVIKQGAEAALNLTRQFLKVNDSRYRNYFLELKSIASNNPFVDEVWFYVAEAAFSISEHYLFTDINISIEYYSEIKLIQERHNQQEVALLSSKLAFGISVFFLQHDFAKTFIYYNNLKKDAYAFKGNEISESYAKAAFNLIRYYLNLKQLKEAEKYFDDLQNFFYSNSKPAILTEVIRSLLAMINYCQTYNPEKLSKLYNEVKSLQSKFPSLIPLPF